MAQRCRDVRAWVSRLANASIMLGGHDRELSVLQYIVRSVQDASWQRRVADSVARAASLYICMSDAWGAHVAGTVINRMSDGRKVAR